MAPLIFKFQKIVVFICFIFIFVFDLVPLAVAGSLLYSNHLDCYNFAQPYMICFYLNMTNRYRLKHLYGDFVLRTWKSLAQLDLTTFVFCIAWSTSSCTARKIKIFGMRSSIFSNLATWGSWVFHLMPKHRRRVETQVKKWILARTLMKLVTHNKQSKRSFLTVRVSRKSHPHVIQSKR